MLIVTENKTTGEQVKCLCVNCGALICEGKFFILKETTEIDLIFREDELVTCPACKTEQEVPAFFSSEEKAKSKWFDILMFGAYDMFFPARMKLI